jgi:hypothetical protein
MAYSAFADKTHKPHDAKLPDVLGESIDLWRDLVSALENEFDPVASDWVFSGRKWGWALRLKQKKRAILYLTPTDGFFRVGMALGEKATTAAHDVGLPRPILELINGAQKYAEGRGVRMDIHNREDVEGTLQLARVKMAN